MPAQDDGAPKAPFVPLIHRAFVELDGQTNELVGSGRPAERGPGDSWQDVRHRTADQTQRGLAGLRRLPTLGRTFFRETTVRLTFLTILPAFSDVRIFRPELTGI
jgi:hypothetical protein